MSTRMDIGFWGKRTYLQSTHLIVALGSLLPELGIADCLAMSAKFRGFARHQVEFFVMAPGQAEVPGQCATFVFRHASGTTLVGLRETDIPVQGALPDDEAQIIQARSMDLAAKTAAIADYPPERFYTALVALNKALILDLHPAPAGEGWILAQLDLEKPFAQAAAQPEIECHIVSVIAGRMVKTNIRLDGQPAGATTFTRIPKP